MQVYGACIDAEVHLLIAEQVFHLLFCMIGQMGSQGFTFSCKNNTALDFQSGKGTMQMG